MKSHVPFSFRSAVHRLTLGVCSQPPPARHPLLSARPCTLPNLGDPAGTSGSPPAPLPTHASPNLSRLYRANRKHFHISAFNDTTPALPLPSYRGMDSHNTECSGDFTHSRSQTWAPAAGGGRGGVRWPLVTNYQVIIAARLMSEVSVITPAWGNVLLLLLLRLLYCRV